MTFLPCHPEPSGTTGKKAEQAIESVLESIAPGNVSWLYQQVIQPRTRLQTAEGIVEATLVGGLVILYEEAAYWYTRQQILSLFVNDYSKTELLNLIPGLKRENRRGKEARFPN